jgi:CHRD domain-containing protein
VEGFSTGIVFLFLDFGTPIIAEPGPSGQPGELICSGNLTLNAQSITDLETGKWFVNVLSAAYTNGEIRGQIILRAQATLSATVVTNNLFHLSVTQVGGLSYIIQANTNLASTNWVSLVTNTAPFIFSDTEFTNYPQRVYRQGSIGLGFGAGGKGLARGERPRP